jgi:hypothetical protein
MSSSDDAVGFRGIEDEELTGTNTWEDLTEQTESDADDRIQELMEELERTQRRIDRHENEIANILYFQAVRAENAERGIQTED